ncbi:hypothetical protein ACMH5Q_08570 [Aquirufa lenticrescens]
MGESDANSTGTLEYNITEGGKVIFKYIIPINHPKEEDLNLEELESKILAREINIYKSQSIDAFYDEDEENFEPGSVYYGLAYNFYMTHRIKFLSLFLKNRPILTLWKLQFPI